MPNTRDEILAKYQKKIQIPNRGVLSPIQDLSIPSRVVPVPKLTQIPTPSFAKRTPIQPALPSTTVKTTTPTTSKVNTYDVIKDSTGLFVDVVRSIPEIRKQGTAAQTGLLQTFSGLEASLGQLATELGSRESVYAKGNTTLRDAVGASLRNAGSRLEKASASDYKLAEALGETLPKFSFAKGNERYKAIAAGIVQNAPNLLGGIFVGATTAAVTKNPSATTMALLGYTSALEGGFSYRDAKEYGATDEQAQKIMVKVGLVNGILETLPISRFLNKTLSTRKVKTQILQRVAKDIIRQGAEEGTTEGLQEMVSNYALQEVDKNRSLFQGVPESAFFGAILGGGTVVGGEVYNQVKESQKNGLKLGMSIEDVSTPEDKLGRDSLVEEAKKYKSAEEFVKAQQVVYHGGAGVGDITKSVKILTPEEKLSLPSSGGGNIGLSTTSNKSYAKEYSRNIGNRSDVAELYINPKAKVYNIGDKHVDDFSANELEELSKKYDVVKSNQENEFRILTDNGAVTKSQLVDIWNRGNPKISNLQEKIDDLDGQIAELRTYDTPEDNALFDELIDERDALQSQLTDIWERASKKDTLDPTNYKSAEEFVKGQGTQMFRSSASSFDVAKMGEDGIFLSPDKRFVEGWQKSQGYRNFEEFVISPTAKILKREDFPKRFVREEDGFNFTSLDDQADIIKYAKDNGFDGIEDYSFRADGKKIEHEFAIWNKDVIKTKSQLTDIYNKANIQKEEVTPQVDEEAIRKTKEDVENAFANIEAELKVSIGYSQGGQLYQTTDETFARQKGFYAAFLPEKYRTKEDERAALAIINGGEVKTERQKNIYQAMLQYVGRIIGEERFSEYEYTQLLETIEKETRSKYMDFWKGLIADMKKQRASQTPAQVRRGIKEVTGQIKAPMLQKRESTLLKERIRNLARGYREGAKLSRDQVSETQSEIIDLIEESGMVKEDRAGFIKTIRNIQTNEQLQKVLPDLQERIDRVVEDTQKKTYIKEIIKTVKRANTSPSVSLEYKEKINEVVSAYELKGHTKETIKKLQEAKTFFRQQAELGENIEIPSRLLKNIEILNRTPLKDVTPRVLESILNDIKLLEKLGRTKFKTRKEVYEIEKQHILTEMQEGSVPLNKNEKLVPKAGERLSRSQKLRNSIYGALDMAARADKVLLPMDVVTDILDGSTGTYDGANYRNIKSRFDGNYNQYIEQKYELLDPVAELSNKYKLDETNFTKMGLVAAREQDGGVDKLINLGYTENEINDVSLTPQEREVLELMKKQMDTLFPAVQKNQRELYNNDVQKVNNYFSFMTDWDVMDETEVYLRMGPDVAEHGKSIDDMGDRVKSNIDPSFVKSRKGAGKQKININAYEVFRRHIDTTAYFVNFARSTKMLGEIVRTQEYRDAVGDAGQLLMLDYIDIVSRQGGSAGASQIAILDILRKNISAGILGLKLSTVAIQWTAVIDGMGMIGPEYVGKGVKDFVSNKELRDMVLSFPEIKERVGGEVALEELKDGGWLTSLQQKGFIPMQFVDKVAASSVALGAYQQKCKALGVPVDPNNINREALEYAQLVVRRTQSSSSFKDVPLAISRGALTGNRSFDRMLLQFQNFLLTRWSRVRHDAIGVGISTKDPMKAAGVLFWISFATLAGAGTRIGLKAILSSLFGEEPEEEDPEKMNPFLKAYLQEMSGSVPFVGNITGVLMYDSEFFPVLDMPTNILQGAKKMYSGVHTETKAKGFIDFSTSVGAILGVPGSIQAQQFLKKMVPDIAKKTEREKILDKYKGATDRQKQRESILKKYER